MDPVRKEEILASFGRSKMMQLFGGVLTGIDTGCVEITIGKKDFMYRPAGMFNGSAIATLVDVSSGYAAASSRQQDGYFTTVELKINYLNPAFGEQLIAKAQVIKAGRVLLVVRADVWARQADGTEELAATSLVTMMEIRKRTAKKDSPERG